MPPSTPIAYLCPKRQVHIIDEHGVHHAKSQLSGPVSMAWWAALDAQGSHAWPTWSPDGTSLASFHSNADERVSRVVLAEANGICSEELATLDDRLPIYLQWADNGQAIAVLCQQEDHLTLSCVRPGNIGDETTIEVGSPMFFTWANDRLALFVGVDPLQPQLKIIDPFGSDDPIILPYLPGNFCAPIWVNDSIVYVASTPSSEPTIYAATIDGAHRVLGTVEGLTALVASPQGGLIARATATGGDGTPYDGIEILDLKSGTSRMITAKPCLAFVWSPTGDALVLAHVNTDRNLLEWYSVDLHGEMTHLIDLQPTRDLGFYLRFFEQYCQSHRLIDHSGENLLVTGNTPDQSRDTSTPFIWKVPMSGGPPEAVAEGMFAVFSPNETLL